MRALALPLVALLALAGCPDYARVVRHDAPGLVPDLDAPVAHENGDPARREIAVDPGASEHWLTVMPYIGGGLGRDQTGAGEGGVELRYEHHSQGSDIDDDFGADATKLTVAAGVADQWRGARGDFGLLYAELGFRAWAGEVPHELAIGPVLEAGAGARGLGAQLTYRALLLFPIRARYTPDGGFELVLGFQVPVPFLFGFSR